MKIQVGTIEKIFLPILIPAVISGALAVINIHTEIKVLETKVSINNERINTIFRKLDELKEGQEDILKILINLEH